VYKTPELFLTAAGRPPPPPPLAVLCHV